MRIRQIQTRRMVIALLVLGSCLMLLASRTEATPINGKIAFESNRDGNTEIYVMNPDGSGQVNISNNPFGDLNPSWSDNGARIAFVSTRDGNDEIYVMLADGSNQTRLTFNTAPDRFPSWSPDGTKIAFESNRNGNFEIFVINADGTNETQLTNSPNADLCPQWSSDGTKIVFRSSRDGNAEIYVMNPDGTGQTRLTNNSAFDDFPSFSPDGTRIAFLRNAQIFAMNADGTNTVQLTSIGTNFDPEFSPDGTKIVFESQRDHNAEIYVMDANGANQTRLTNTADNIADSTASWQAVVPPVTIGVFRPSTSQWLLKNSNSGGRPNVSVDFGQAGDLPVTGDWNGDGITDLGVFRNGQFLLRQAPANITTVNFGQAGDLPIAGDWNGDGTDDLGVFRTGQFILRKPVKPCPACPIIFILITFNFGQAGDTPLAGDWNGDGIDTVGIFNAGSWTLRNSNSAGAADITVQFGTAPGARPVVGDWNGDGIDTIGVLLPSNVLGATTFGLNNVNSNLSGLFDILAAFGGDGDLPVSGDWDGRNTAPNSGVNDPDNGGSVAGHAQTFVTTCSDPDGWHDIATIDFKIARSNGNGQGVPIAIWAQFDENQNLIRLYDPDLQIWREGPPGSNLVLENGFVQLNLSGTSVQGSGPKGPSVQVRWEVVFKSSATGKNYKQYLKITDDAGAGTAFDNVGSWSVLR
jgi:Tol biopolymer transport system component